MRSIVSSTRVATRPRSGRLQGCSRLAIATRRSQACGTFQDKGSNLDLHVQSVVSCRLDDPGSCLSVQLPAWGGRRKGTSVVKRRSARVPSLLCPCHSPTLRPWIAGRVRARPRDDVIVEGLWSPSLVRTVRNSQAKAHANVRAIPAPSARAVFLSQAGPRFVLELVQAEHHLCYEWVVASKTTKATRSGSPSAGFAMRLVG